MSSPSPARGRDAGVAHRLSSRFGMEATVLLVVAALAILLEVGRTAGVAAVFAAWAVVAALELHAGRRAAARPPRTERRDDDDQEQPVAGAEPFAPEPESAAPGQEPQPLALSPFDEARSDGLAEAVLSAAPPRGAEPHHEEERTG